MNRIKTQANKGINNTDKSSSKMAFLKSFRRCNRVCDPNLFKQVTPKSRSLITKKSGLLNNEKRGI